ncbi:MAG: alpha/beta hydrolase [Prolixibacteraceae bacterium]
MGGFVHDTLYSPSNKIGIGYCVVLPKTYYQKEYADTTYPVIYFLHGYTGYETADVWNAEYYYSQTAKGQFPEVIMVFPNGMNEWYINNANGKTLIETHIIHELLPFIDQKYRTNSSERGITGFSMGGYGAVRYYLKYPGLFNYAVSIDGSLYAPEHVSLPDIMPSFGNITNLNENSVYNLLDMVLENDSILAGSLNILVLEGDHNGGKQFIEYAKGKGVNAQYFTEKLEHSPSLFYDRFWPEILQFEKEHLTK